MTVRAHSWRGNLALVAISIVLALLVAEVALRVLGYQYPDINMLDPLVGWRPRPGVHGWYQREGHGYISINREGYRDVDHAVAKPPGTYRIAVLGDSMTEGREVMLEQTFWKRLETLLPACPAFAGRKIEVLGFAVNGYGTAQEYLTLKAHVLKYQPDLVLLSVFTGNDFTDNSEPLGRHRDRPYFTVVDGVPKLIQKAGDAPDFAWRMWWGNVRYHLIEQWRVVQMAQEAAFHLKVLLKYGFGSRDSQLGALGLNSAVYAPPKTPQWRQAWTVLEALVQAIADTAHAHGAAFVLMTLSNPIQVAPDVADREAFAKALGVPNLTYPDRRLADYAAAHGFPDIMLVGPLADYAAAHHVALHGFDPRDPTGHWNALGHRLAAEQIAKDLCADMATGRLALAAKPGG